MATRGILATATGIATIILAAYALDFANTAGVFRPLSEDKPGTCHQIPGFLGPEDIAVDEDLGLAYVTIADRFGVEHRQGSPKGNIALLDLKAENPSPLYLTPADPDHFFPHGLDLHIDRHGQRRLFVVNHGRDGNTHSIDVYLVRDNNRLELENSFTHPLISSPNDVAAVGPDRFFTSNDRGADSALGQTIETYFMLPWGNVVYFEEGRAETVVTGLKYANGVSYDSQKDILYVAESTGRRVTSYALDALGGQWRLRDRLSIPTSLDNMSIAPDGSILGAGHPKILEFLAHAKDTSLPSSSEVIRIGVKDGVLGWESIYLDRGAEISAASIAVEYEGRLFIGAVFDDHMVMCNLEE